MKMRIKWFRGNFFPVQLSCHRKSAMKQWIRRPVGARLLAGLLCCLPIGDPHAQIVIGGFNFGGTSTSGTTTTADSTSFQGQAAAVSGFAMGGAVSVADTGPLSATG